MNNEEKWFEREGIVYFSVTSNGLTGEEWIKRLKEKGFNVYECAKRILRSSDFKPTCGVTTKIAVLKNIIFGNIELFMDKIHDYAKAHQLSIPNAEIACLIREKFSDEELKAMGFYWVVVMHEPIKDFDESFNLLAVDNDSDDSSLRTDCGEPGIGWGNGDGFAFVVSQTSNS